jgi:hypothetical protein
MQDTYICSHCGKEIAEREAFPCRIDWCPNSLCPDCQVTRKQLCPEHEQLRKENNPLNLDLELNHALTEMQREFGFRPLSDFEERGEQ